MVNLNRQSSHQTVFQTSDWDGLTGFIYWWLIYTHQHDIIRHSTASEFINISTDNVNLYTGLTMSTAICQINIQALCDQKVQAMRDCLIFHRKMDESVIKFSKKFGSHKFHRTTEEVSVDELHYHHNAPIHLRHMLSHSVRHQGSHHRSSIHDYMSDDDTLDEASHCRIRHGTRTGIGEHHKIINFPESNYIQRVPREFDATSVQAQEGDRRSLPSDDGAEVIFTVCNGETPSDDGESPLEDFKQTAAESTLPWKCSFNEEPVSSSQGHELQDDSEPLRDAFERSTWMNEPDLTICRTGDAHSLNCSASELSVSENDHFTHPYSSMTDVPQQLNGSRNYLCDLAMIGSSKNAHSCSRSAVGCFDDDANNLPLPWRTSRAAAESNGLSSCASLLKCSLAKSNSVTSADIYSHGPDSSAMLPLPWRNFSVDRALPDQQAPRRTATLPKLSLNSSAASLRKIDDVGSSTTPHDHDSYSVHPQASCHSFRLSEAESRHSESITHQHHMIEIVPPPPRQGLEWYDLSEGSILDMEQMDSRERVSLWLLSAPDCAYDGTEDFSSLEEF